MGRALEQQAKLYLLRSAERRLRVSACQKNPVSWLLSLSKSVHPICTGTTKKAYRLKLNPHPQQREWGFLWLC